MPKVRDRSPSPLPSPGTLLKKLKTTHVPSTDYEHNLPTPPSDQGSEPLVKSTDPTPHFANDLFDHNNIASLNSSYLENEPYKYAIVDTLFQDDLLKKVKDECLTELSFTEKETDIYKVF